MKFGLLGEKLSHSYSSEIHSLLGLDYFLCEVNRNDLEGFIRKSDYNGFNVTIPYKESIIPYLDYVDETAKEIGSVNVISKKDGKLYGYNTDVSGFSKALELKNIDVSDKVVCVLGSGGTSKTIQYYLKEKKAKKIYVVSRTGEINYQNYKEKILDSEILINATPVGSFPNNDKALIDLTFFKKLKFVFDCVYNPFRTDLLIQAENLNISCTNGLNMLIFQAFFSEIIWGKINESENNLERILTSINNKKNIVLIGMPSAGKTTIAKVLAEKLNKIFIDSDLEVEKTIKTSVSQYINKFGEKSFREIESKIISLISKHKGAVISTGGGVVLTKENIKALKQNGIIFLVKRKNKFLTTGNRPISLQKSIRKLYHERKSLYISSKDYTVKNDGEIEKCVEKIIEYYENSCNQWC